MMAILKISDFSYENGIQLMGEQLEGNSLGTLGDVLIHEIHLMLSLN